MLIRWPEPFGLVMTGAMACGTPVIAFAEGAAPELVLDGSTGFLVDDESRWRRLSGAWKRATRAPPRQRGGALRRAHRGGGVRGC